MHKLIECVPNFSEGRDKDAIKQIVAAIESVSSILLLDVKSDVNHNRTVVSFIGPPTAVIETAFKSCQVASKLIDLNKHQGEHPRMGATDVIPLIPIQEVTLSECVALSHELGQRIGKELGIPVFFYEASALRPSRENLADVRSGEFEGLKKEIGKNPLRIPDAGPNKIHPTAGVVAVGTRMPLIAFNINLNTTNVNIAKEIAKTIRFKDGGFRFVKALGFELSDRKLSQVSINMTNYQKTSLYRVFETVKDESERRKVSIAESEIVGLVPQEAIVDIAKYYLQLEHFSPKQILENAIKYKSSEKGKTLFSFLEEVSAKTAVPGGGSVAALLGALAASLFLMVLRFSLKKSLSKNSQDLILNSCIQVEKIRNKLKEAISQDVKAYENFASFKTFSRQHQQVVKEVYQVPMNVLFFISELLDIIEETKKFLNQNLNSDFYVCLSSLEAAINGAYINVIVNLKEIISKKEAKLLQKEAKLKRSRLLEQVQKIKTLIKF